MFALATRGGRDARRLLPRVIALGRHTGAPRAQQLSCAERWITHRSPFCIPDR